MLLNQNKNPSIIYCWICREVPEVEESPNGHSDEERLDEGGKVDQDEHVWRRQHWQRDAALQ